MRLRLLQLFFFLLREKALRNLPYGPAQLFFRGEEEDGGGKFFFKTDRRWNRSLGLFSRKECCVAQLLARTTHKHCVRFFSQFHSGMGQPLFGNNETRYCDYLAVYPGGKWHIIQYHENSHLGKAGGHEPSCRRYEGEKPSYNGETEDNDEFNREYAKHLSDRTSLVISYEVLGECYTSHKSSFSLAKSLEGNREYVVNPSWTRNALSEDEMVGKILGGGSDCEGYVVIESGRESLDDLASETTGFCLQRDSVSPEELGATTLEITKKEVRKRKREREDDFQLRAPERAREILRKRGEGPFTLLRKGFGSKAVCLPVNHFRWLVKERKLSGFKLLHFYRYSGREYLKDLVHKVLQERHELKLAGLGNSLHAGVLKVFLNSFYGFTLLESTRFSKYTFSNESSLGRRRDPASIKSLSIVGAAPSKRRKLAELYYLVERGNENAQIRNLSNFGGAILGWSRVVIYSHMLKLLNCLDLKMANLTYMDTDSLVFHLGSRDLLECVLPARRREFEDSVREEIFGSDDPKVCQPGYMKIEGFFKRGIFRSPKTYYLEGFKEGEILSRSKGIPSRIQRQMTKSDFELARGDQKKRFYQSYYLNPTVGGEIALVVKSKKQSRLTNMKRLMCQVRASERERFQSPYFLIFCRTLFALHPWNNGEVEKVLY